MEIVSDNDEDFGLNVNIGEYVCTIVARCTSRFIYVFFLIFTIINLFAVFKLI